MRRSVSLTGIIRQVILIALMGAGLPELVCAESARGREKPPSFGDFYPAFKEVCVAVAQDNMAVEYYQLLTSLIETPTAECLACKNFFRGFASSCRPKTTFTKTGKKKSEEDSPQEDAQEQDASEESTTPTPEVVRKPKLPSYEVVDAVSSLGILLSEDRSLENFLPSIAAVFHKRLIGKGEKDNSYFYTVAVYLTQSIHDAHEK